MAFITSILHSPALGTLAEFVDATYVWTFFFLNFLHTQSHPASLKIVVQLSNDMHWNREGLRKVAAVDTPKPISEPESVLL